MFKQILVAMAMTAGVLPAHAAKFYVGNFCSGIISEIDSSTHSVTRDFQVGTQVFALASHPTEPYVFASLQPYSGFNPACPAATYGQPLASTLQVVNTLSGNVVRYLQGSSSAWSFFDITTSSDGRWLYVNASPYLQSFRQAEGGSVFVYDNKNYGTYQTEVFRITGLGLALNGIASGTFGGVNKVFVGDNELQALHVLDGTAWTKRQTIPFNYDTQVKKLILNGNRLYVLTADTRVFVFDATTETLIETLDFAAQVYSLSPAVAIEGNTMAIPSILPDQSIGILLYDLVTLTRRVVATGSPYTYTYGPIAGDGGSGFYLPTSWSNGSVMAYNYVYHLNDTTSAFDATVTPSANGFLYPRSITRGPGLTCTTK